MPSLKTFLRSDPDSRETLFSTSRSLILTTFAIYLAWHFIATLSWPARFSPSLWAITLLMVTITTLSLRLLENRYIFSQLIWWSGLVIAILAGYGIYRQPEITILLVFLPLMAIVTLSPVAALIVDGLIVALVLQMPNLTFLPPLETGYAVGIILGSFACTLFGWSLSNNLLSANASSTYHYRQARKLLTETRQHRAEISRMLKDQNQANYNLGRLNLMLSTARAQADEARADRDRFILAVSHELRSPLNFILGFSDLMVNSPKTYAPLEAWPAGLYDDIQEMYRSSKHLLRLINDILDMGQIDAQQMTVFRERARLEDIVESVCQMATSAFDHKGLYLRIEYPPDLPFVFIDCTRLRQVVLNLVNNSLRFTEEGGVTIRLWREDDHITVSVVDTGLGIALEDIPKVFDEFRQVGHDNWRRREGTGLGLSISKRFIELHGGKIWLESEIDKGTCFYFTVPIQETLPEPLLAQTSHLPHSLFDRHASLVLALTRNHATAQLVRQSLPNHIVIIIEHPEQLLPAITQHYPRAILVDHELITDSQPLLNRLPYELPVLQLNSPGLRWRESDLPDGIAAYLVKPITRQLLLETITSLGSGIRNLLIVDDDAAMQRFITKSLEMPGEIPPFSCLAVQTGHEALQHLRTQPVDVVLLDLDLPDMSGWLLLKQLQADPDLASIPIVIISAANLHQMLYAQGQELFSLWMNRPLSLEEFNQVLNALIDKIEPHYPLAQPKENIPAGQADPPQL